jgi:glyoxylase-like metal-dependent hydrolase (beta-lactamase superfamily II)
MLFRQLFDSVSGTYTYLLASRRGGEALIIDPVIEKVERYLQLVNELDLKLVKAVDTHLHADHITGLGALRDRTHCITVMGEMSKVDVVSMRLAEGDKLTIEGVALDVLYTPGHTDDSYSFRMNDRVFTGDTLLIRGTGRTDFQNGDARAQYDSIFNKLLKLPDETLVFPAHDYKGETVTTIGEEKRWNPRLQVTSVDEYAALMASLDLPNPKMMDVAVPANMRVGLAQEAIARRGWAVSADEATTLVGRPDVTLVDLREKTEREKHGVIPGSLHAPYPDLAVNVRPGGMPPRPANASCSIAPSANARRWRCRRRRTPASRPPAISRAVSMPGRRRAGRWRAERRQPRYASAASAVSRNSRNWATLPPRKVKMCTQSVATFLPFFFSVMA